MARRLYANPLPPTGPTTLSARLGHHLGRIARIDIGDPLVLFNGLGDEATATVEGQEGRDLRVLVHGPLLPPRGRSPLRALDVAVALPKSPRTDWLLEHGTEAGIRSFRPILTERTNRQPDRHAAWQRVLIAACAQCDRALLPTIEPTVTLAELCALRLPAARFVATTGEQELGPAAAATTLLVVGPEGGFTAGELEQLLAAGFLPRSLGPLTLRTETAVLAGAIRLLQAMPG
ncbi:MAG: 16S rRNA (uracil(1498)-N(3))-methyltransferase [Planctomycetes bacterium]|nr:16S rRNA (uracil(1498)-N(3))-methyltransferase [Planctomycetota bacterium]